MPFQLKMKHRALYKLRNTLLTLTMYTVISNVEKEEHPWTHTAQFQCTLIPKIRGMESASALLLWSTQTDNRAWGHAPQCRNKAGARAVLPWTHAAKAMNQTCNIAFGSASDLLVNTRQILRLSGHTKTKALYSERRRGTSLMNKKRKQAQLKGRIRWQDFKAISLSSLRAIIMIKEGCCCFLLFWSSERVLGGKKCSCFFFLQENHRAVHFHSDLQSSGRADKGTDRLGINWCN